MLPESHDSSGLDIGKKAVTELCPQPSRDGVEEEHGNQPGNVETKQFKLACALTRFTAEGFYRINWTKYGRIFSEHIDELDSFSDELFGAMARFIWNLYDEEDFENVEFADDIVNECERIQQLVWPKGNSEPDLSLLDISKYDKVREQDVCNLLMWCNENKSPNNNELAEEWSEFKDKVVLLGDTRDGDLVDFPELVAISKEAMLSPENLDPKGATKHQLRMELIDGKCSCIVDALYMKSWEHINFQKFVPLIPDDEDSIEFKHLECFACLIREIFYWLVELRIERLHYCGGLVTYPLSANIFGSWDSEVLEVVKQADLKRRSEGRRFIGPDHLVFCIHQRLVSESAHAKKNSNVSMSSDNEEKHKDTVYHLYEKANYIATELGHETIGLEHLYVAIITTANDDKCYWKDSSVVKRVRKAKTKRKGKCKEEDKPHPDLWKFILEGKLIQSYNGIDVVKKIQDEKNKSLQCAIKDVLFGDKKQSQHQMSQGEMIRSLKKNIKTKSFKSSAVQLLSCLSQLTCKKN